MTKKSDKRALLKAPERLTVEHAAGLLDEVRSRVSAGEAIEIDLSAVAAADTAGIQLLAVLRQRLAGGAGGCTLTSPSESVLQGAELLGLAHVLEEA